MDMSSSICVTGLPKCVCRTTDLYRLFSRVAQVKKIRLNPEKGTAVVTLWDSSSLDFVFSQTWTINGKTLTLEKLGKLQHKPVRIDKNQNIICPQFKEEINATMETRFEYTLTNYKDTENSFWRDVPHSDSNLVSVNQRKRKRRKCLSFNHDNLPIKTNENRKKKAKMKKKKKSNIKAIYQYKTMTKTKIRNNDSTSAIFLCDAIESSEFSKNLSHPCASVPNANNSNLLYEKNSFIVDNICTNNLSENCSIETANHKNCDILNKATNSTLPEKKDIENSVKMAVGSIPLLISTSHTYLIHINTSSSLEDIHRRVYEIDKIPSNLQMVIHQGKMLTKRSNILLQPYDSVQILIRGKGGMQSENDQEVNAVDQLIGAVGGEQKHDDLQIGKIGDTMSMACSIDENSLPEDVQQWYSSIGITSELVQRYDGLQYLDGDTIFKDYSKNESHKLASDIGVPIGLARRILLQRDKLQGGFTNDHEITSWNSKELIENFIEKLFSKVSDKTMVNSLSHAIMDKFIDGLVFMSYENADDMASDFKDVDSVKPIIYKQLLKERDKRFKQKIDNPKQDTPSRSEPLCTKKIVKSTTEQYDKFIEKYLKLQLHKEALNDGQCCKLKFIDIPFDKCDEFQKKFSFFVLCSESEFKNKNKERQLWKQILKNTKLWVTIGGETDADLMLFKPTEKEQTFQRDGKEFTLMDAMKILGWKDIMEKRLEDIQQFSHCIILVSKQICTKDVIYKGTLSTGQTDQEVFYFSFKNGNQYAIFDAEDKYSFRYQTPEICSGFGHNIAADNEVKLKSCESSKSDIVHYETPRQFMKDADYFFYHQGHLLPKPESSGTMLNRCTEYKLFTTSVAKKTFVEKFLKETLRFAAGCLNTRRNGTIYFGIGDSVGGEYKHGEIIGFPDGDNEVKVACTDNLRNAIKACFSSESNSSADKCIAEPYFIEVVPKTQDTKEHLFVMEIDIEPHSEVCQNLTFEVNMAKYNKLKGVNDKYVLYRRDGASTSEVDENMKKPFITCELNDFISRRERLDRTTAPHSPIERPLDKFCRLLCKGNDKLDKSSYPIFVLGKPTDQQKNNEKWMKSMSFLKRFPFVSAVFDFDDKSNENGFCKFIRNEDYSTIISHETFGEYLGNAQALTGKLNRNKTIWIFSNGRSDLQQPHLQNLHWQQKYIGVNNAVIFCSLHTFIPRGRALILIILFSNDFDGVIETFYEIHNRFSRDQILILAEHFDIFKMFESQLSKRMGQGVENLGLMSVIGVKWKDINTTVNTLVEYDQDSEFWIPGHLEPITERFRDRLTDLELLNSKQCEGKKKDDAKMRIKMRKEKEMEFYRGNKVTWWNFYYESHVMKRHHFDAMIKKLQNLLKHPHRQKYNVINFNLEHQPGAGGSTFIRHILWTLRKENKCAVVKNLSENTPHQILELWKLDFSEEDNADLPVPVVVFLDDVSQVEVTYEEFVRNLKSVFRNEIKTRSLTCLVCICSRVDEFSLNTAFPNSINEVLHQKLSEEEIIWMENKTVELEKEGYLDLKPENLLSFMALRTDFNQNKIASIVKSLMSKLDVKSFEFQLVQFIALITYKTPILRRSTKVAVPLECCDDFHYFSAKDEETGSWERILSMTTNILLVFEDKETAGGKQIRMAHPIFAKPVLEYALKMEGMTLCELTLTLLKSKLMGSTSRGRDDIFDCVHQMLNRRVLLVYDRSKENENAKVRDNERLSDFSPLIESIIEESKENEKGYKNAVDVLEEGNSLFIKEAKFEKHAGTLSQTLARLHSKWKHFDEAVMCAKKSLELSSKENKCYFLHTYGKILMEQFTFQRGKKIKNLSGTLNKLQPGAAVPLLKLILGAFEKFLDAQQENIEFNTDAVLYSFKDAIITINLTCQFLKRDVTFPSGFDLKTFFIDDKYLTDCLPDNWEANITSSLRKMKFHGEKAFSVFERRVCFFTAFNDNDLQGQNLDRVHLTHQEIKRDYAKILAEFCDFFGEDEDEPPDYLCRPEMDLVRDQWHRRRILKLQCNTYMNVFAVYDKYKRSKGQSSTRAETISTFKDIKKQLSRITHKEPSDIAVWISVNIAIGLIGTEGRDSISSIVQGCRQLMTESELRIKEYGHLYDLGCYFISMLMWPFKENRLDYDDELYKKCLKHLKGISKRKYKEPKSRHDRAFFHEEKGHSKPTTQFFLANEGESKLPMICHRFDIFFKEDSQYDESVWEKPLTRRILKRVTGQVFTNTKTDGSTYQCIKVLNEKMNDKYVEISQLRGKDGDLLSEERVTFYLGFSMTGPIAYNIKPCKD